MMMMQQSLWLPAYHLPPVYCPLAQEMHQFLLESWVTSILLLPLLEPKQYLLLLVFPLFLKNNNKPLTEVNP